MKKEFSIIRSVILLTISMLIGCQAPNKKEKPPKLNLILIMADDQGWGDTGYKGHSFVKKLNLDTMAKQSVVFDRSYAGAPVCSPTRARVMTGRIPVRTNIVNHGHYMRPNEITIAEALKTVGYVTGFFGKSHIGSVQKESPKTCPEQFGFDESLAGLNFFDLDPSLSRNGKIERFKGQATYSDRIIKRFIEAQQAGEPTPFSERLKKNVKEFL